jgi:hypothetical protein
MGEKGRGISTRPRTLSAGPFGKEVAVTAEIAIMNKEAVALAADSAVTMENEAGEKAFQSANKIFALSKYEPLALMIWGNAGFMGVPWEPTIKVFREKLGRRSFGTVAAYADEFLRFLFRNKKLFPKALCDRACWEHIADALICVRGVIDEDAAQDGEASPDPTMVAAIIDYFHEFWRDAPYIPTAGKKDANGVRARHAKEVRKTIADVFTGLQLTKAQQTKLADIGLASVIKCPEQFHFVAETGLVFAGFGTKEFYPALEACVVNGIFDNRLHQAERKSRRIGVDNTALIIPFAQRAMVQAFMEGIDPTYQQQIFEDLNELLLRFPEKVVHASKFLNKPAQQKLLRAFEKVRDDFMMKYIQGLKRFRQSRFIAPVTALVEMLPKSELATMAESMVNLTSMRRKISMETETVGGPIDVAMISKGDGLIWIKRKHYFDPRLNPQFFQNYNREANDE